MSVVPNANNNRPSIRIALGLFSLLLFITPVSAERLPIRVFTSADGLGSSFVDTMMRDSRGFLWFCTRDGLSRFDGTEFVTYQVGTENTSPGIENIYETSNGSYWIVTTGGLYRFKSDILSNSDTVGVNRPILKADYVSQLRGRIFEDRNGKIWLTADKVFQIIENNAGKVDFEEYDLNLPKISEQPLRIFQITQAVDGSLWIGTNLGIFRRLPDERFIFYSSRQSLTDSGVQIKIAKDGRIWLSLATRLFIVNPAPVEETKDLGSTIVVDLELVPKRNLGTRILEPPQQPNEIIQYSGDVFFNILAGVTIFQSTDGNIWLTNSRELFLYDGKALTKYGSPQGLVDTGNMMDDIEGNLWISGARGLMRLNLDGLVTYNEHDGLKALYLRSIQQSSDGKIYASQGNSLLGQFDGEKFQTISLNIPANSKPSWASRNVWQDRQGEWWVLSQTGLYHFPAVADFRRLANTAPLAVYGKTNGLRGDASFQVFEDSRGDIWISTLSAKVEENGLSVWSRQTRKFTLISDQPDYPKNKSVASFAEDSDGTLWMGFYEGGVARFRNGRFTEFGEPFGVPSGLISDLLFDRSGRLWIATTRGGLLRVDNPADETPRFSPVTIANGLASNNIRTITQDLEGNLYLGTVRGIDRLSPETGQIQHFSIADGLATDFVVDSICDKDGTLWFATLNGLSKLVPKRAEQKEVSPPRISKLKIAGQTKPLAELGSQMVENLDLSANENNLQIDFFGLNFNPAGKLRYQYFLVGADNDWSQPSERQTVSYANLQPGSYRFLVRTVSPDGNINPQPAVVSFTIHPPFYRSWWFIGGLILLAGVAVVALDRYRVAKTQQIQIAYDELQKSELERREAEFALQKSREERIAELQKVRSRIATDLHDDIGSSLTQISLYSELARQLERENGKAGEQLDVITNVANELVESMSDIVWAINPKKDHLQDLTQRMRRFAANVLTATDIDLEFDAPDSDHEIPLGANIRREVFLIFKETVNNIAKHSDSTAATIRFSMKNSQLIISFEDNGKGFDPDEKLGGNGQTDWKKFRGGNGLLNMRKRATELGGDYEILSELGKGTIVILSVPLEVSG